MRLLAAAGEGRAALFGLCGPDWVGCGGRAVLAVQRGSFSRHMCLLRRCHGPLAVCRAERAVFDEPGCRSDRRGCGSRRLKVGWRVATSQRRKSFC